MPDRILKGDFGESLGEMGLSWGAAGAYPYFQRAFDNFGCARDNRPIIKLKAFLSWRRPSPADLDRYIDEYVMAGLVEITDGWMYLTRWFKDNRFYGRLRPVAPMPRYMAEHMTAAKWESADVAAFEKAALAMGAKKESVGNFPDSPGQSRTVRPKAKQSKAKQSNPKSIPTWLHQDEFIKVFKRCWRVKPSDEQDRRAEEWAKEHGWTKLRAAMLRIGGDYGFKCVSDVLQGKWDRPRGERKKPGRQQVDVR